MSPFRQVHIDVNMPRWVVVVLCSAPFFMGGLGAFAVISAGEKTMSNCEAIQGLRKDLVRVVRDGESQSARAITDAFEGRQRDRLLQNLERQTDLTVDRIDDPECP